MEANPSKQAPEPTATRQTLRIESPARLGAEGYLTAEVSASAVQTNLGLLRRQLPAGTGLCAVVKANCYGHGQQQLLPLIAAGSDCLAVATPEEALTLRKLGYEGPMLMFFSACAFADAHELVGVLSELIARRVTLTVAADWEPGPIARAAEIVGRTAEVHLMIDTGMTRSGVRFEKVGPILDEIARQKRIKLTGLYTHLATADEADKGFARRQLQRFGDTVAACGVDRAGLTLHAANSAATIDLPEAHLDMVRPGIAIYGYSPSDQMHHRLGLVPALRLTARLMQIKDVPAGQRCGYGQTYEFQRDSRVGLVPIGYGDGYIRCLSNRAAMQVCGKMAPVRGRISMDQTVIDLTEIPEARIGDSVEIISNDPAGPNSVANLARLAGTIPYEITCLLGRRVRRRLVD
ncbi:MAG: alanine racemase [Phycisphaerae bacterium]